MTKIGYTIYCWVVLGLGFCSFTLLGFICWPFFKHKQQGYYSLAKLHLHCLFFLTAIKVNIHDTDKLPDDNVIIVANHQSLIDIFVLMAYFPKQITFFAKKELKKVPLLGLNMMLMGHVFVDRGSGKKSMKQLNQIKSKLLEGRTILLFPEGTRSTNGVIGDFKKGAFLLSKSSKKHIVPCYIKGSGRLLPKNSWLITNDPIDIYVGDYLNIESVDPEKKDVGALAEKTREIILEKQALVQN